MNIFFFKVPFWWSVLKIKVTKVHENGLREISVFFSVPLYYIMLLYYFWYYYINSLKWFEVTLSKLTSIYEHLRASGFIIECCSSRNLDVRWLNLFDSHTVSSIWSLWSMNKTLKATNLTAWMHGVELATHRSINLRAIYVGKKWMAFRAGEHVECNVVSLTR